MNPPPLVYAEQRVVTGRMTLTDIFGGNLDAIQDIVIEPGDCPLVNRDEDKDEY